jgi:hypothetical protein
MARGRVKAARSGPQDNTDPTGSNSRARLSFSGGILQKEVTPPSAPNGRSKVQSDLGEPADVLLILTFTDGMHGLVSPPPSCLYHNLKALWPPLRAGGGTWPCPEARATTE